MFNDFQAYLAAALGQAPQSWRKGAVITQILISLLLIGGLYLGWHFDAYPVHYFLVGTTAIAAFDVLVILPYQLWKADRKKIAELEDRLTPKIRLFLHVDPVQRTGGIEFAKGQSGQSLPYIQISAEPITTRVKTH